MEKFNYINLTSETMYSNDRKAPRMKKAEFATSIITKDAWKEFQSVYGEIPWEEFYSMWMDIAQTIRTEAITNPLGVKLGAYMGELKYQYLPHNLKGKNQGMSEELGEEVNHVNLVTRSKVAKIKWERRWAVKFNKMLQFFAFEPTREMNKLAKDYIDENPERLRVSKNTLGGYSVWRQLKNYGK